MARADLDDFVECHKPGDRHDRKPTWSAKTAESRWRAFSCDEITHCDKCSLDLFWLRDKSLEDSATLPDPNVLAQEIADDLRSALEQIEDVLGDVEQRRTSTAPRTVTGSARLGPQYQISIYAPLQQPFDADHCTTTIMGEVVKPIATTFGERLTWFCFTRYGGQDRSEAAAIGVPTAFGPPWTWLKLRFEIDAGDQVEFENALGDAIAGAQCWGRFADHDFVSSLGSDRHIGEDRSSSRRSERAQLAALFLRGLTDLAIHALVKSGSAWRFEDDDLTKENPGRSSFQSAFHLVFNATSAPISLFLSTPSMPAEVSAALRG